ncbi:uncharacterized protein LOC132740497, partial [Ruditapes philippinarum]|uniref:uncharacterized protein LOC132740497 n=1 Tax=Ruditapes philippinarum TaxID=129788 RepID=UPI00295B23FE
MSRQLGVFWIFLWILAAGVSAQNDLSIENFTWPKAKERGNMATPTIKVNNTTLFLNISSNVGLNENEEAWVGYYQKETAFSYIGCGHINSSDTNILLPHSRKTPGLCYSLCDKSEKKFIALNKDKCFCMSEIPSKTISLAKCDISPNGTWMAGGGDDYMSIYEKMNTDIYVKSSDDDGGKCFVFQNTGKNRWWFGCDKYFHLFCKS